MNEWEWQLLEDKSPVEQVEIAGAVVRVGTAFACGRVKAAMSSTSRSRASSQPSKLWNRITKARSTSASCWMTILAATSAFCASRAIGSSSMWTRSSCLPPEEQAQKKTSIAAACSSSGDWQHLYGRRRLWRGGGPSAGRRALPAEVRVGDFGIRGFDLAYALQDGYETTILIDAYPRGDEPGTFYVVEPDLTALGPDQAEGGDSTLTEWIR